MANEYQNPIDAIFDEDNNDVIILFNEKGEEVAFEQVALIPLNEKVYVILNPIQPLEGLGENEALAFEIAENEDGEEYLALVIDEKTINDVFDVYDKLVEDAQ